MSNWFKIGISLVISALVVAIWALFLDSDDEIEHKSDAASARQLISVRNPASAKRNGVGEKPSKRQIQRVRLSEMAEKPVIDLTDEDEKKLDALQKEILDELRHAIDEGKLFGVRKAIARMKADAKAKAVAAGHCDWTRHVPRGVRRFMVDSLGWFGGETLVDLVEYMADADAEIAQSATDQFELAMEDPTMGDRDRAEVIKVVSGAITDEDMADWLCMEINNMRHSVGIDTILYLNENGTNVIKAKIPETMEFFTGEDNITTVEEAQKWLEENPDDPDDDEIYGPMETPESLD